MYSSERFGDFMVQRNWLKRFRSLSLLSDSCGGVDADENYSLEFCSVTFKDQQRKALASNRFRTRSNNYVEENKINDEFLRLLEKGHDMLHRKPKKFPFQSIPANCKLRVFSYLSLADRGRAAQVCGEWSMLMKSYNLWDAVDLISFPYPDPHNEDNPAAYEMYKRKLRKFLWYLTSVGAPMKSLRLAYDIGDHRDGWLDLIQSFLRSVPCQELEFAEINWKETPARPPDSDVCSITWCTSDYNDLMYRQRHRQRLFVKFFDFFTAVAPAVRHLVLPFDWSERSLQILGRLSHLKVLVLEKYFLFQGLDQRLVDQLLVAAPRLTHLTIDVWTPSGHGLQLYRMHSLSLRFLDISQCRGFCLVETSLPNLEELRIKRAPLYGPIISNDQPNIPCLGQVLQKGAGRLRKLNCHVLTDDWHQANCTEFDLVLQSLCSCNLHKLFR